MNLTLLSGYPDLMGRRMAFCGTGSCPSTYTAAAGPPLTGGDTLTIAGYETYIDCVLEIPIDPTGYYYAIAQPSFNGPRATWKLFYYNAATGALITTAPATLTGTTFLISGFIVGT